jgi:hypothetical protein
MYSSECRSKAPAVEYTGLFGFVAKSVWSSLFPDHDKGKEVYYQGSRQIDNVSRRYYEMELGAGIGPSLSGTEHFGYTEPIRRCIQREDFTPQANEIPNTAPSWLPGDDYYTNFKVGDPYIKVDQGFARLPGAGYEAIHPELKGVPGPSVLPNTINLARTRRQTAVIPMRTPAAISLRICPSPARPPRAESWLTPGLTGTKGCCHVAQPSIACSIRSTDPERMLWEL